MARLDDSPSLFTGQPWTVWGEVVNTKKKNENTSEVKEEKPRNDSDAMKLRKKDMTLFGLCPAQDEFYLVVCERCDKVIKPQALKTHIEQRHDKNLCRNLHSSTSPKTRKSPIISSKSSHGRTANAESLRNSAKLLHCAKTDSQTSRLKSNTHSCSGKERESPSRHQKLKNHHSMPVVKVERMPSPIMVKKAVSVADELSQKLLQRVSPLTTGAREYNEPPTQNASMSSASPGKITPPSSVVPAPKPPPPAAVNANSLPTIPGMGGGGRTGESGGNGGVEGGGERRDAGGGGSDDGGGGNRNEETLTKAAGGGNLNSGSNSNDVTANKKLQHAAAPPSVPIVLPPREKLLPCKDRVFDPNKHCGVTATDTGKPCTRSLTCKTHALSLRRAVQGRRKPFDQLLQEHRDAKEALLQAKAAEKAAAAAGHKVDGHATTNHTATPHPVTSSNSTNHHQRAGSSVGKTSPHNKVTKSAPPNKVVHKVVPKVMPPKVMPPKIAPKVTPVTHSPDSHRPTVTQPVAQSVPTKEETVPMPETCSRLSSDGEADGEEPMDKSDFSHIPYHPRPAMMNTFGGRLAGHGCYVLNRKTDLLRAAFRAAVERHLHPPPHKKLCVESKLPQDSQMVTDSKDPYEFNFVDTNSSASQSLNMSWSTNKLLGNSSNSKPKIKPVSRTIKPKEPSGSKSPVGAGLSVGISGKLPNSGFVNSTNSSNNLKRKRSGSSTSASVVNSGVSNVVSQPVANLPIAVSPASNPISIAIPTGINLNLSSTTLNNINASLSTAAQPQPVANAKNNYIKDFSIVVTNIDPSVMNGQIINIPSVSLSEMTQLQLTNLADSKNTTVNTTNSSTSGSGSVTKVRTKSNSSKHSAGVGGGGANNNILSSSTSSSSSSPSSSSSHKSHHQHHQIRTETTSFANINTLMAAMANNNAVVMDSGGLASGTLLTTTLPANSHAISLGNHGHSNMSPPLSSPSTCPSPLVTPASSSPQVSIPSPLANGIVQSPPGIGIKNFPFGANHSVVPPNVTVSPVSRTSTPSPSLVDPDEVSPSNATVHMQKNAANKTFHASSLRPNTFQKSHQHQQSHFQLTNQPQQPVATAISLTPGGRLITTAGPTNALHQVYAGQMVTHSPGFTNIQIQPKPNSKHSTKGGIQQVLTLPIAAPPVINAVTSQTPQSARTLFIASEERHKRQLSQNSSSTNVIS